jgi:transcriptional regulator with XRE-family HTH domain
MKTFNVKKGVGKAITTLRRMKKISQKQMADSLKMSLKEFQKIEKGDYLTEGGVFKKVFKKISDQLQLPPSMIALVGLKGSSNKLKHKKLISDTLSLIPLFWKIQNSAIQRKNDNKKFLKKISKIKKIVKSKK